MKEFTALLFFSLVSASCSYSCSPVGNGDLLCRLSTTEDVFIYDSRNQNHLFDFLIVGYHHDYPPKRSLINLKTFPQSVGRYLQPLCMSITGMLTKQVGSQRL